MQPTPRKIVLKFGSGILTRRDGVALDDEQFEKLTRAVAGLVRKGVACTLVTSGAAAAGMMAFRITDRPGDLSTLQACCAVGQTRLMHFYETLFRQFDLKVAQILLTNADFQTPGRGDYVRNTLDKLLAFGDVVPIINENDSVAVEELKFGDNDELSSRLAVLVGADLLVLLTSVDGLMGPDGEVIPVVPDIDAVLGYANPEKGAFSVGGMVTKLRAVRTAVNAGIPAIIAAGHRPEQLEALVDGGGIGTRFLPQPQPVS